MDEDVIHKIIRVLIALVIAGLAVVMALMIVRYRQDMRERSSQIAALSAEAGAYESELNELRREQEVEEMHLYTPEGPGAAVIAFLVNGEETLRTALDYGETYDFKPTILLRMDDEELSSVIETLADSDLDIILYSRGIDTAARIRELQEQLSDAGCHNTYAFLLRASDDTEENRRTLARAGITTLFLFGESLSSDVTEDGTVELNYSYVNKSSYTPASRLTDLDGSEQGLLFAIDLADTTATEHQLDEILSLIRDEADAGHITIGSVDAAVRVVKERLEREEENLAAFLAAQEERRTRIEELEQIIAEIYSHWDE